jgi:flagellar biosynthesis protein FlhG
MTTTTPTAHKDQASRLRAIVSSLSGPGVSVVTLAVPAAQSVLPKQPRRDVRVPVVALTSGKGGVGKTSLAVNLAIKLSARGCRVSLLDADLGLANADLLCGLNPTTRLDAAIDSASPEHVRRLDQIAVKAPGGFRLVPGAVGVARIANLTPPQREVILDGLADLERESDLILVDTGAGLGDGVTTFLREADLVLVVATPEPTSIADSYALMKCLVQEGRAPVFALITNMVQSQEEALGVHARLGGACRRFLSLQLPLIGIIRRDEALVDSVRERYPVALGTPRAKSSRDIDELAGRLIRTLRISPTFPVQRRRGLFGWLMGR